MSEKMKQNVIGTKMINGRILHEDEDIMYGLPYISTCISI